MDEGALQELLTGENWFVLAGLAGALLIAAIAVWRRVRRPERRRGETSSRLEAFGEAMEAYGLPADSVRVSVVDAADVEFVTPEEELAELMLERGYAYDGLKRRLGQRQGDEPAVMALREEAEALVDAGRLADAEETFEIAFERQIAAVPSSEQLRASAAWDKAAQARVAFLRGDLLRSAELFGHAAETAPDSDELGRWAYRLSQAQSLREHGVNDADEDVFDQAAEILRQHAPPAEARDRAPALWASATARC